MDFLSLSCLTQLGTKMFNNFASNLISLYRLSGRCIKSFFKHKKKYELNSKHSIFFSFILKYKKRKILPLIAKNHGKGYNELYRNQTDRYEKSIRFSFVLSFTYTRVVYHHLFD